MKRARKHPIFLAIVGTFLLPIALAYVLFYSGYGMQHRTHKGTLMPRGILAPAQRTWIIAALNPTNPALQHAIATRRQALGKDQTRVQLRTWTTRASNKQAFLWPKQPINSSIYQRIINIPTHDQAPCSYVIADPKGRVVLCYSRHMEPKDLDQDLRKLLKYSRIG